MWRCRGCHSGGGELALAFKPLRTRTYLWYLVPYRTIRTVHTEDLASPATREQSNDLAATVQLQPLPLHTGDVLASSMSYPS